jgi:hypothetical protein
VVRWLIVFVAACSGSGGTHHVDVSCASSTVYLNRFGGMYAHSTDDATVNVSEVIDVPRTIAAYPGNDAAWADITSCIRDALAPFEVVVTETDPGSAEHLELVFTDAYWGGTTITTAFPSSCATGHQIEFVFGNNVATPVRACEVAMGGLAEMLAQLGPSENCLDFTSPAGDCGVRSFIAEDVACVDPATNLAAPCRCDPSATTQNSFTALNALFHPCE